MGMKTALLFLLSLLTLAPAAFAMPAQILLLRHGEKPAQGDELSPRGWERAKALPGLFERKPYSDFGAPAALFGMAAKHGDSGSIRAIQTLKYVSERFRSPVDDRFRKGEEKELARELRNNHALDGKFVVICWEHKMLSDIAAALGVNPVPQYPGDRFDRAWLVTMEGDKASFRDLPEKLLDGDDDQ
jgi:hypothetical protein